VVGTRISPYRLQRSLSDLNGTDPLIHQGDPKRLLQVLENTFARPHQPEIPLFAILEFLGRRVPAARQRYGSLYTAGAFRTLVSAASGLANDLRRTTRRAVKHP
jgi:hypothetical protein